MDKIGYFQAIFHDSRRAWGLALLELLVIGTISLIPLAGAALRESLPKQSTVYLADAFEKSFLGGQLLFYSIGFVATIIWHCNKDMSSFFPLRAIFNLYALFVIVICSIIIGYDPTLTQIDRSILANTSVSFFISSAAVYAFITVISQVHVNVGKSLAEDDAQLASKLRISRGIE